MKNTKFKDHLNPDDGREQKEKVRKALEKFFQEEEEKEIRDMIENGGL